MIGTCLVSVVFAAFEKAAYSEKPSNMEEAKDPARAASQLRKRESSVSRRREPIAGCEGKHDEEKLEEEEPAAAEDDAEKRGVACFPSPAAPRLTPVRRSDKFFSIVLSKTPLSILAK